MKKEFNVAIPCSVIVVVDAEWVGTKTNQKIEFVYGR